MEKSLDVFTKRTITTAFVCCVILWLGVARAQAQTQPPPSIAKVTPTKINFGNLPFFGLSFYEITVQDIGTSNLNISNVSLTLGPHTDWSDIYFLNQCKTSLAPGKNCNIFMYYLSDELEKKSATLHIKDNVPDSPQKVILAGTGIKSSY